MFYYFGQNNVYFLWSNFRGREKIQINMLMLIFKHYYEMYAIVLKIVCKSNVAIILLRKKSTKTTELFSFWRDIALNHSFLFILSGKFISCAQIGHKCTSCLHHRHAYGTAGWNNLFCKMLILLV